MSITIERTISGLEPGDVVPLDSFGEEHGPMLKRLLLDELEARGFVLDSRNVLGEVQLCTRCEGEGELNGKCCQLCDGYSTVVDWGKGLRPYKQ
jgi:hypothetical protein